MVNGAENQGSGIKKLGNEVWRIGFQSFRLHYQIIWAAEKRSIILLEFLNWKFGAINQAKNN